MKLELSGNLFLCKSAFLTERADITADFTFNFTVHIIIPA